jgi:hypothetical protein
MTASILLAFIVLTFAVVFGALRAEWITLAMGAQAVVLPVVCYRLLTKLKERHRFGPLFIAAAVFGWAELITVDMWASNVTHGAINYLEVGGPISWAGTSSWGYPATTFQMPFGWWATIYFLVYLARYVVYPWLEARRWDKDKAIWIAATAVALLMGLNGPFWEIMAHKARYWIWQYNTAFTPLGLVPMYVAVLYGPGLVPALWFAIRHTDDETGETSFMERTLQWSGVLLLGLAIIFIVTLVSYVVLDALYQGGWWPWDGNSRPDWLLSLLGA